MTEIICSNCGNKCYKPSKEIKRQIKKKKTKFFCSLHCSAINTNNHNPNKKSEIILNCLWCQKSFISTTHKHHKKCCNNDCARKYAQSFCDKNKLSDTIKKLWDNGKYGNRHDPTIPKIKICIICKKSFEYFGHNDRKTCSNECYRKLLSKNAKENPNCGGETNYKKYRYKGVWMDSTWEKDLAEWMDEKGIIWERSRKYMFWWIDIDSKKRRYYPDFYLPTYNLYVDTKNPYLMECDKEKIKSVLSENKIKLIVDNLDNVKFHLTKISSVV